jgi:hypothetical protein
VPRDQVDPVAEFLGAYTHDPLGFVMVAFPWGEPGALQDRKGPEAWQATVLTEIGKGLQASDAVIREAVASGHGVGKSALVSWIVLWALLTCKDARVAVTANTEPQLRTKTWPEVLKWFRMCAGREHFTATATTIFRADPDHRETWKADALTWSENNTEAFAGLHNVGKRIVLIFDEASAIADKVWEVAEGALTDKDTEIIWCAFGNPTRNVGRFRECWGRFRDRWKRQQVDSRSVSFTNKDQIGEWVNDYGEDSDFVRVRVRGEFPRAGSMQFIGGDRVEEATKRELPDERAEPLVMGVDVARHGDDQTVIRFRRGRDARSIPAIKLREFGPGALMTIASRIFEERAKHNCAAVFIDVTGMGWGVFDRLVQLNCPGVVSVDFSKGADRSNVGDATAKYANKRAEIWGLMRDWLKQGCIDADPDLKQDLTAVEYGYNANNEIQLERKQDMKKRGIASPDNADALATTFAYPVASIVTIDDGDEGPSGGWQGA